MGVIILFVTSLLVFAFLYVFTGLNMNRSVQQYETSFSLGKLWNFGLKVDKGKATKAKRSNGSSTPH